MAHKFINYTIYVNVFSLLLDSPNVSLFVFQGNINKKIGENDVGTVSAEITKPTDGKWLYENRNLDLKVGDVINYYVYVVSDKKGYLKDNLSFTVKGTFNLIKIVNYGINTYYSGKHISHYSSRKPDFKPCGRL